MEAKRLNLLSDSRMKWLDARALARTKKVKHNTKLQKILKTKAGIRFYQSQIKELNEKQRHLIALLVDFTRKKTQQETCDEVGISVCVYNRWRNDPFFLQELDKEISRRRTFPRLEAMKHVFKQVNRGNMRVIRDFLKMTGDYKEKLELTNVPVEELPEEELNLEIERLSSELGIESPERS
jgi:hypothetical protein